ncbi:MAG: hypothetical protein WC852_06320 [Candidatus Nanoarchaeia archaeon]|jgi:hypothetical protein
MAFVNKNLEDMLREIEVRTTLRCDTIIPAMDPKCPKEWAPPAEYDSYPTQSEVDTCDKDETTLFIINNYSYSQDLFDLIQKRRREKAHIYHQNNKVNPLSLALENAFYHGNQNNPDLPVWLMAFEGDKGVVVSIKDSGNGFDFKKTIEKAKAVIDINRLKISCLQHLSPEETYCKRWGTGFWAFTIYPVEVSFEERGARANLLFLDSEYYDGWYSLA